MLSVPATYLEELMTLVDVPTSPASVHMELRVEGRLDAERMRHALRATMAHHPLARAELRPVHLLSGRRRWRILDEPPEPVVTEVEGEGPGDAACDALISTHIDETRAPLHRTLLIHSPTGDRVVVNLSHLAGDGVGQLVFLRSLRRAYVGEPQEQEPAFEECRDLRRHLQPQSPARAREPLLRFYREALRAPQRVAGEAGGTQGDGYGIVRLLLEPDELRALALRRGQGATLNDLLLAELVGAVARWNREHDVAPGRVSLQFAFNLRPSAWRLQVMGNYAAFVPLHVPTSDLHDGEARIAHVRRWTTAYKQTRGAGILGVHATLGAVPCGLRALLNGRMPQRFFETAALSNLGADGESGDFGAEAGRVLEHWFSPPSPPGLGFAIGAIGAGGRLFLAMRYLRSRFSHEAASRFMRNYRSLLLPA